MFFSNNVANENEGGEDQKAQKKQKKDKTQAIAAILLSNAGEYRRLLEFFSQEVPKHILKVCSIAERNNPQAGQFYDLKKLYGHLSSKQQMLLKMYAANFNKLLSETLEEGAASEFVQDFLVQGQTVAQVCLPYGLYRKKLAANCTKVCVEYSKMQETTQILAF